MPFDGFRCAREAGAGNQGDVGTVPKNTPDVIPVLRRGDVFQRIKKSSEWEEFMTEAGGKQALEKMPAHEIPARFSWVAGAPALA